MALSKESVEVLVAHLSMFVIKADDAEFDEKARVLGNLRREMLALHEELAATELTA